MLNRFVVVLLGSVLKLKEVVSCVDVVIVRKEVVVVLSSRWREDVFMRRNGRIN